jgi:uncharacterized protein (TIGR03435 family)
MLKSRLLAAVGIVAALAAITRVPVQAQSDAKPLAFEVASVKLRQPGSLVTMMGGAPSGSRLTLEAMSLSDLVSWAYDVKPWQVTGGPPWAGIQKDRTTLDGAANRFDIVARAEGEAPRSLGEFRQMMQTLLTDRFHLTFHRESRETPVYALVIDKNGPKFHEAAPDATGILRMNGRGRMSGSGATIPQLVSWFSNANGVDRPVIDQTRLTGRYDFTLEWSNTLAGQADSTAPSIFTAFQEQLGLKLDSTKAPVDVLVIDHVELPTPD